jgi:hypothetical protein
MNVPDVNRTVSLLLLLALAAVVVRVQHWHRRSRYLALQLAEKGEDLWSTRCHCCGKPLADRPAMTCHSSYPTDRGTQIVQEAAFHMDRAKCQAAADGWGS